MNNKVQNAGNRRSTLLGLDDKLREKSKRISRSDSHRFNQLLEGIDGGDLRRRADAAVARRPCSSRIAPPPVRPSTASPGTGASPTAARAASPRRPARPASTTSRGSRHSLLYRKLNILLQVLTLVSILLRSLRRRDESWPAISIGRAEQGRGSCDVPMAQFIVNLNASMPASDKFILHMLDPTHMFVQPHVAEMIRGKISEFRDQNSYEKPT
uniref:RNA polymerase II transcription factor B subunit 5 n=1 Tax=Oryza rufipogon TaxID=4529 RepID=A0A0E0PIP6_ORYRU